MNAGPSGDWTTGAAKWFAVIVLGAASIAGIFWSITARKPASWTREPAPQVVEIRPNTSHAATPTTPPAAKQPDIKAYPREKPAPADAPAATPATTATSTADSSDKAAVPAKLDLNTATVAQLELLPGIGPAIAKRIVEYREEHGKFATLESLDAVKGIGPKTIARLRPLVTIE